MSTNATIAIQRENGTKTAIYLHYDGYIEAAGATLQLAYNTAEKVEELLKLGDLSVLGYYTEPKYEEHNFEKPERDVCVAYHRDRGEPLCQSDSVQEYYYLYDARDAVWYVESEIIVTDTKAMNMLGVRHYVSRPRTLLLDEILQCDFSQWRDDEFATAENVHAACIEKAKQAREKTLQYEQDEYDAYYRAYCD